MISSQLFSFLGVLATAVFAFWGLNRKTRSDERQKALDREDRLTQQKDSQIESITIRVGAVEVRLTNEEEERRAGDARLRRQLNRAIKKWETPPSS